MRRISVFMVVLATLLSACATKPFIESRVSVFHALPSTQPSDATFLVLPWRDEMKASLEFGTYAQQVSSRLQANGFVPAATDGPVKYVVFFDYGIDDGRIETATYSVPRFGVTGYTGATTTGTVNRIGNTSYVNTTTTATPMYGVTGMNQVTQNTQVFRRFVKVDILEVNATEDSTKPVYEGNLKSEGTCGNLPSVMPVFLQALLDGFPGQSGVAGTVQLPWTGKC